MKLIDLMNRLKCHGNNYISLYINSMLVYNSRDIDLKNRLNTDNDFEIYKDIDIDHLAISSNTVFIYCIK